MEMKGAASTDPCSKPTCKPRWPTGEDQPSTSFESDLCCMEDSWDKESPDPAAPPSPVRPTSDAASALRAALPARVTASERAPLRRPRPGGFYGTAVLSYGDSFEERMDSLTKLLQTQDKFRPARHQGAAKPLFYSVSPFVAERRRWFVAWKSQMARFFGYSRDTVAVALNYFDRYTSLMACNPALAQAVAVTSLHIAAKFEEPRPAPLRELIKFTPVFTAKKLLTIELSVLKVLDWELRPVTVYDCVRGFCSVLPEPSRKGSTPSTLSSKERKEQEVEQLRVLAEEIADFSAYDVSFVEFMPSTMAISAILLSVSHSARTGAPAPDFAPPAAASSGHVATTSHKQVLDAYCRTVAGIPSLDRVLDCVQLLGTSLAESYPAVAAAAGVAAAEVARYADRSGATEGRVLTLALPSAAAAKQMALTTPPLAALSTKSRRCCTPTGVEGIMHIESAAVEGRAEGADGGVKPEPAKLGVRNLTVGDGEESGAKHPRPTPCSPRRRHRGEAFALSDEDVAFARAVKRSKSGVGASRVVSAAIKGQHRRQPSAGEESSIASRMASRRPANDRQQREQQTRSVASGSSLQLFASPPCPISGSRGSAGEHASFSSAQLRSRMRSAEALGHCESGSGFGAPAPRVSKADAGPAAAPSH